MKSYSSTAATVLSAFVASAYAQNTLIPTGISTSCSEYLAVLDASPDISTCLSTLVDATAAFNPTTGSSTSDADLTTAVNNLCTKSCDETKIRSHLSSLYTACQADLLGESPNEQVTTMYDLLYVLTPLREAVCAKDTAGKYCVQQITVQGGSPQTGAKSLVSSAGSGPVVSAETLAILNKGFWTVYETDDYSYLGIYKRQDGEQGQNNGENNGQNNGENNGQNNGQNNGEQQTTNNGEQQTTNNGEQQTTNNGEQQTTNNGNNNSSPLALVPDTEVYRTTSLIYLFVNPNLDPAQLCTPCTTNVLAPYVKFESATPYAMGLSNSPILGEQITLWKSITEKCGQEFSQSIMKAAGIQTEQGPGGISGASKVGAVAGMLSFVTVALTALMF